MNNWKVTLELSGKIEEVLIKARTYSEVYIKALETRSDWKIVSIKLILTAKYSEGIRNMGKAEIIGIIRSYRRDLLQMDLLDFSKEDLIEILKRVEKAKANLN